MEIEELKKEIKNVIISSLELEDVTAEDIKDDEALFGEGLGLDSIDALELGVALKKHFGVKFSSEYEENKKMRLGYVEPKRIRYKKLMV